MSCSRSFCRKNSRGSPRIARRIQNFAGSFRILVFPFRGRLLRFVRRSLCPVPLAMLLMRRSENFSILLVCADEQRLNRLKDAIHSAGFRTISARRLDDAWTRTDFFDFGAVVIDHELKNDIAASAFGQRFIVMKVGGDATPLSRGHGAYGAVQSRFNWRHYWKRFILSCPVW